MTFIIKVLPHPYQGRSDIFARSCARVCDVDFHFGEGFRFYLECALEPDEILVVIRERLTLRSKDETAETAARRRYS
jgi:hypothetical protein